MPLSVRPLNYLPFALLLAACGGGVITNSDAGPFDPDAGPGDAARPPDAGPDAARADLRPGTTDLKMGTPDLSQPPITTPCGSCPAHAHCDPTPKTCVCDPGYVAQNNTCVVAPIGDVTTRTQAQVCEAWKQGRIVTDTTPWTGDTTTCDPGTLSRASVDDVMRRVNLYRWLTGLYPSNDDPTNSARDQKCALMLARNGMLSHNPPTTWKCYTAEGAAGAGSSNLAGGASNANSIDLYINDGGTPSLGHRRWVLNPPLNGVGVGFVPNWQCLGVFGGGNQAPPTKWQAVPNPGVTPLAHASYNTWSVHSNSIDLSKATATVTQNGMTLPTTTTYLPVGYGVSAIGIVRQNWQVTAGATYTVTVSGTGAGTLTYDVKPVNCP